MLRLRLNPMKKELKREVRKKGAKAKRDGPEESHQPREKAKSWTDIPGEGGDAAEGTDGSNLRKQAG